jgi:hypothetical protein
MTRDGHSGKKHRENLVRIPISTDLGAIHRLRVLGMFSVRIPKPFYGLLFRSLGAMELRTLKSQYPQTSLLPSIRTPSVTVACSYIVSCTRGCRIDPAIYSLLTASTPLKVTEGKRGFKWQRLTLYTVEPVASHPGHGTAGGAFLGSGIIPVTAAYRGKSHFPILIGGMDVQDKCPDHYIDRMSHTHVVFRTSRYWKICMLNM